MNAMESTTIPSERMDAWWALLQAHSSLISGVERALAEEDLPPLGWYDVLATLERADDNAVRPRDLGCGITISRSGMTRLLERIVTAGLVERVACERDRRGTWIVLTEAGTETLNRMKPVYESELRASFSGQLSDEEAQTLSGILARVGGSGD
jgi:DNA-binding MarR family transcriptional regulator